MSRQLPQLIKNQSEKWTHTYEGGVDVLGRVLVLLVRARFVIVAGVTLVIEIELQQHSVVVI